MWLRPVEAAVRSGGCATPRYWHQTSPVSSIASPLKALNKHWKNSNLQSLADRPAAEVLEALVDNICPEGGTIDEAVARDAMIEAIVDFASEDLGDFNQLTQEQLGEFVIQVIAKSITIKIINEIGTNSLHSSATDTDFQQAESTLKDYTLGAVGDAFQQELSLGEPISSPQINDKVKEVFSNAFEILQVMLEEK